MVNYKESASRARETSTFRFTAYEKQLLAHLADLQGMTQTALIRSLLEDRASQLGIDALPAPQKKRRPGRPKMEPHRDTDKSALVEPVEDEADTERPVAELVSADRPAADRTVAQRPIAKTEESARGVTARAVRESEVFADTFGALIVQFQQSFRVRSEKMQHELENTIRFVTGVTGEMVLLPPEWLLADIDAPLLTDVRERIRDAEMRFPQKNLHLTYLRMMFNFAVKEGMVPEAVRPMETLRSFTAKEVADAFPLPIKTI
ncbi:MAG: hypothetical protein JXX14_07270 [Deltaproteobacteria bacterium]|nr:hypothetical protein [Deltaproteobacteria bacterium]